MQSPRNNKRQLYKRKWKDKAPKRNIKYIKCYSSLRICLADFLTFVNPPIIYIIFIYMPPPRPPPPSLMDRTLFSKANDILLNGILIPIVFLKAMLLGFNYEHTWLFVWICAHGRWCLQAGGIRSSWSWSWRQVLGIWTHPWKKSKWFEPLSHLCQLIF